MSLVQRHSVRSFAIITFCRQILHFSLILTCLIALTPGRSAAEDLYFYADLTDENYAPERIKVLITELKADEVSERLASIFELQVLGSESRTARNHLLELIDNDELRDGNSFLGLSISSNAVDCLASMELEVIPFLAKRYSRFSDQDVQGVAEALSLQTHSSRQFLRQLVEAYRKSTKHKPDRLLRIARIDPTGEVALPLIREAISDQKDEQLRLMAAACLTRVDEVASYEYPGSQAVNWFDGTPDDSAEIVKLLLKTLEDKEPAVRAQAVTALETYPEHEKKIVMALLPLLKDDGNFQIQISIDFYGIGSVSERVVSAIAEFPDSVKQTMPAIIEWHQSDSPKWGSVTQVQDLFATLIPQSKEPLTHLRSVLESKNPQDILLTIANMGEDAQPVIGRVGDLLRHQGKEVRSKALITLACVDERWKKEAVDMLRKAEKDSRDEEAINNAAADQIPPDILWSNLKSFVFQVGDRAKYAHPVLLETVDLNQEDWDYGEFETAVHILSITTDPTDELLDQILHHSEFDLTFDNDLEECLTVMGQKNPQYFRQLLAEKETTPILRILAMRALGTHDRNHAENLPLLASQFKSQYPAVREAAVEALGQMQVEKPKVVELLTEALKDPRVRVRAKALENLSKFDADAKTAIPSIIKLLSDDYLTVQVTAIRCLGELGKTASPAIEDLKKLSNSEVVLLREEAKLALQQIQTEQ